MLTLNKHIDSQAYVIIGEIKPFLREQLRLVAIADSTHVMDRVHL